MSKLKYKVYIITNKDKLLYRFLLYFIFLFSFFFFVSVFFFGSWFFLFDWLWVGALFVCVWGCITLHIILHLNNCGAGSVWGEHLVQLVHKHCKHLRGGGGLVCILVRRGGEFGGFRPMSMTFKGL